ncbi:MAG: hypothetical protein IJ793_03760 [Opitutales bacterium]|nr:hypothetical protein [Opitutales bacterium]
MRMLTYFADKVLVEQVRRFTRSASQNLSGYSAQVISNDWFYTMRQSEKFFIRVFKTHTPCGRFYTFAGLFFCFDKTNSEYAPLFFSKNSEKQGV